MVRPSKSLAKLLDEFICVRVTDMRGVNLARYDFDFDLTFALLAMDVDGQVYHRYGGRDERGADTWLSGASLEHMLEASLNEHDARAELRANGRAKEAAAPQPLRIEEVPSFKKRDRGECIHCHSVNTSLYEEALNAERLTLDWIWKQPSPTRVGIDLERDDQQLVKRVDEGSAAAAADVQVGDRLILVGDTRIASASDVMHALDKAPAEGGKLALVLERAGERVSTDLDLASGWKRGTPREFAWRPTKWAMLPAPGFGGPELNATERKQLGLDAEGFLFRVQYMVTWGDNRRYGQAAGKAGLRVGDVVLSVDGRTDFDSIEHFHAWWRLTVPFGKSVPIRVLRDGEERTIHLVALR